MKTFRAFIRIGALFALTFAVAPAFTGAAQAYQCKANAYSGAATKAGLFMAKASARRSWEQSMKEQFDLSWSVWSIAQNKSIECHMTGTKHTCLALANPCRYVVQ
ncbi:MAG TPA: hypothetical protein VKN63_05080 [Afifellaceae bacterium]|nr:hypothetical protein [Afifellaceae bacterium]